MNYFLILCLLLTTLLQADTFVYECKDNKHFTIQLLDKHARLLIDKKEITLEQEVSASGLKYTKNDYVFFQKGYEALLDTPELSYRECSNNRFKAVWADAKFREKSFRAIGNEPGWYLEIGKKGKDSILVTDYGQNRYELQLPRPYQSASHNTRRYRIKGFVDIQIENRNCVDSVTGLRYSSRVKLRVDGKSYRGCGKYL